MKATYDLNTNGSLVITVGKAERKELKEAMAGSTFREEDTLEHLIANSDLDWIDPAETGDLTSAPMLGIRNEKEEVVARWAFMDYQVRSFVEDLVNHGRAVFTS